MYYKTIDGSRLRFRPIHEDDAALVTEWRNTDQARAAFFNKDVVTPDSHALFCRNRKPHDLVWLVEAGKDAGTVTYKDAAGNSITVPRPWLPEHDWRPIGMTSLTVDVKYHTAEYGRTLIDPDYQGQGYAKELEYFTLYLAFEWLRVRHLWLDAYTDNVPVINLHHKTGWRDGGVNLAAHQYPGGDVLHMTYDLADWPENRAKFVEAFGVTLP